MTKPLQGWTRKAWLAIWLQHRRRARAGGSAPPPVVDVLVAVMAGTWLQWNNAHCTENGSRWAIYYRVSLGGTRTLLTTKPNQVRSVDLHYATPCFYSVSRTNPNNSFLAPESNIVEWIGNP